jgi:hypothetical protein
MFRIHLFAPIFAIGFSSLCAAAPMAYFTGGVMTMLEFSTSEREAGANVALSPRDALGFRVSWMESRRPIAEHSHGAVRFSGAPKHESAELTYTRLVQRWNTEAAQVNIWALGGLGATRGNTFSGERFAYSPGLQFDVETTRVYFSLKGQMHRARGMNNDVGVVRAGFSFWESEYDATQPWFIVEAKRTREFSEKIEITPMLRFINKQFFAEIGIDQDKKVKAGLMVVFSRM